MDWNAGNKNASINIGQYVQTAFLCLLAGKYGEAFLCLSPLANEDDAAIQYNLALCCAAAGDLQTAANYLEKALSSIRKIQGHNRSQAAQTATFKVLRTQEVERSFDTFSPMPPDFPQLFPEEAQQDIVMALILIYKKIGLADKAKTLSASLIGEQFGSLRK